MKYSIFEIAGMIGADSSDLHEAEVDILLTDSRSLVYPARSLFFAIRTASNDGHHYLTQLYEKGVRNFVVEHIPDSLSETDANFIVVPDTIAALQRLASVHRHRFHIPVLGITGSRGKTVVKEWLYQLLRDDYRIVRSPRSYNSQIGVPLSLWDIDDRTDLAIIEAGISHTGEIEQLAVMIDPTVAVITNVGNEHSEGFASMAEKCEEKLRLAKDCGCVVYNNDDTTVCNGVMALAYGVQELSWSRSIQDAPLFVSSIIKHGNSTDIHFMYLMYAGTVTIPFTADADIEDAITCIAALFALRIPVDSTMCRRFARLSRVGSRINVTEGVNKCLLVYDTYTCDYLSLAPSLDFMMRRITALRTPTVILSDVMKENEPMDAVYGEIAGLLSAYGVNRIIGVGKQISAHKGLFPDWAEFFDTTADMMQELSPGDFANELILIKGTPESGFDAINDMLEARQHETVLEVNLDALVHNFNFYRSHLRPTTKIVCMLKASGYGAGSYELAKTLQTHGAAYIAVAAHDEGVALRNAGITMPIMVLNPKVVNYKALFDNRLEPEIFSFDICREFIHAAERYGMEDYPVHIKIDSGMHRLGFIYEELPELIALLKSQKAVRPVSVFSHLATADDFEKTGYAEMQLDYFDKCSKLFLDSFEFPMMRHILNTDGILRFPQYQYEMVRLGIGLYGIPTLGVGLDDSLRTVSSLRSVIIQIREWDAGTAIGYGCHGMLSRRSRIATIPIGYADGFNRKLGRGVGEVYVNGKRVPTVGNICMDLFMADVTDVDCKVGDKVEIFGEHITAVEIADKLGTIPYEVLTSVSERVKRVYYRE